MAALPSEGLAPAVPVLSHAPGFAYFLLLTSLKIHSHDWNVKTQHTFNAEQVNDYERP